MKQSMNSLRPIDAYIHRQAKPSLVEIRASDQFVTKPISEANMVYCDLDPQEQTLRFE